MKAKDRKEAKWNAESAQQQRKKMFEKYSALHLQATNAERNQNRKKMFRRNSRPTDETNERKRHEQQQKQAKKRIKKKLSA